VSPDERPGLDPAEVVDQYGERIYALARRLTGNDADAEDVTQNTLVKILRKAADYRGDGAAMAWIYRITLNEARELFRARKRRPAVSLDALPIDFDQHGTFAQKVDDFTRRPERRAEAEEIERAVRDAIEELPDGYREAVVLVDLQGLPYQEAAEILDLGVPAFKTRLHRARLHLRNRLEAFWSALSTPPAAEGER
jgi:RNA polymerase sigma-70 factor (ECF subfamily)